MALLRNFKTPEWSRSVTSYLSSRQSLRKRYAAARKMQRIRIKLPGGKRLTLSGGGQNILIKEVLGEFCERWTPGASVLYLGDTDDKFLHIDSDALSALGIQLTRHGKMPDIVVYDKAREWLVLIEAVTSHGPIGPQRHADLRKLFAGSKAPLVFVTTFLDHAAMARHLDDIAWETDVWVADAPTHMMHFNGGRFFGPHEVPKRARARLARTRP